MLVSAQGRVFTILALAAVPMDEEGRIASEIAVGASAVLKLAGAREANA